MKIKKFYHSTLRSVKSNIQKYAKLNNLSKSRGTHSFAHKYYARNNHTHRPKAIPTNYQIKNMPKEEMIDFLKHIKQNALEAYQENLKLQRKWVKYLNTFPNAEKRAMKEIKKCHDTLCTLKLIINDIDNQILVLTNLTKS